MKKICLLCRFRKFVVVFFAGETKSKIGTKKVMKKTSDPSTDGRGFELTKLFVTSTSVNKI